MIHPLVNAPLYRRAFKRLGLSVRQYLDALSPALSSSVIMLVAILVLRRALPATWPPLAVLCVETVTGVIAYVGALVALRRDRISVFYQALKLLRN